MTRIYFDFQLYTTHLIPQILTIRDIATSRGGYLGFRLDRAAESTGEAPTGSQVVDMLLGLIQ